MQLLTDYTGQRIRLTDERRSHIGEHPEMAGMENALPETLAEPARVVQSLSDPSVSLYYRFYRQTRVCEKWLCVVVKAAGIEPFVIAAYLTDRLEKGPVLWPSTSRASGSILRPTFSKWRSISPLPATSEGLTMTG